MAAELTSTALNHETHLLLDQPLLRLPQELLRKNFKTAQKHVERENKDIVANLKTTVNASLKGADASATLKSMDSMIARAKTLKRKMEMLREEEKELHAANKARLLHVQELFGMESLVDVKYDAWSRVRLDRFLVEYLVRQGYVDSATALAKEKGVERLCDLEVFARCERIAGTLRGGKLEEGLAWCAENRVLMKKLDSRLEFELRLQQYVELCRQRKVVEAREYARKHFPPYIESQKDKILLAAGLLAILPDRQHRYERWYSKARWEELATLFVETHHQLFSLPPRPLLLIALSAGLSALKTPSCHSKHASSTANASSTTTSVCPICSTELNELARKLPYAQHSKSYVENDPVKLPNGRVYGRDRLLEYSKKIGLDEGKIQDLTTGEVFPASEIKKVYIT